MIITGQRILGILAELRKRDAERIFVFATHGLFIGDSLDILSKSNITEVIVTNSIEMQNPKPKIIQLSLAKLLADTIQRIDLKNL
mmetsp:Transcript_12067/g.1815  ORF Transcript_12067/g.1815 Transcript_12067/m.1815 type:complete len:85 (+) Transcript_12067:779-1033(+)